jgi:hypothetical protein
MRVCMHSRFIENQLIQILEDGLLISEVVLSQCGGATERGGDIGSDEEEDEVGTGFVGGKGIMGQENVLGRVALVAEKERKHVGPQGGFGLEGNVEE